MGDVVFIHAGISPEMKGMDVEAINRRASEEIGDYDRDRASMVADGLCLPTSSAREMVAVITLNGREVLIDDQTDENQ